MTDITFRTDFVVKTVRIWGDDASIVEAAQALDPDIHVSESRVEPVMRALLARKVVHTSPFEHCGMSVWVDAPAVVWWEWTRHRFQPQAREDHSFNLESGRYKVLRPHFYLPPTSRPIREPDGFKAMRPNHADDPMLTSEVWALQQIAFSEAWRCYQKQIELGVAREVARNVLGPGIYYAGRVSGGVLSWLNFLTLRTRDDEVNPSSYPQWEIEQVARQCESILAGAFPVVHRVFVDKGRTV